MTSRTITMFCSGKRMSHQLNRLFLISSAHKSYGWRRVVKAERGAARREEYVKEASKAAVERVKTIEDTRLIAEEAR